MREVCNVGLGHHGCEQFPQGAAADAIRFHVANDAGELINIQYVFEKGCWPAVHGTLDVTRGLVPTLADQTRADEILRRQAEVFVESYLRRRSAT